uniref:ShlB/FhaC/HecB family hemolysin secretion/activation protein n=1 Tax=Pseudomonas huaxiensis TaxID=2213017 RepID=UPI0015A7D7FF
GGSTVEVGNTPKKPWRANLSRNNDGQLSTGEQQWGYGLEWDSPLGLADQLMLRGGRDAVSDHQRTSHSEMLFYNLPWGWWNFSYSYSQSAYRSQAEANTFTFKQTGDTQNHQLRAERVIHRDSLSKTSLSTGLAYLRSNNYIEDSRLENSSNRLSEAQFGINHGRRIGGAFVNLDLGMQQGIGAFDAQADRTASPGDPDARYRKYSLTISYLQPFQLGEETFSFSSLATGQRSEDPLFSPQRLSLGGLSSVRGYKDQSLTGDSGAYWRNDLRWTRPVALEWLRPVLAEYGASVGYDQGVIRGDRYNGDQHGRVSSNALELFARGQHLSASVTFAHSLERPDVITEREAPIYFRVELLL